MPFSTSKNMAVWLLRLFTSIKDHVLHVSLRKKKRLKIVVVFLFCCWAKISQALAGNQNFPSGHWKKFQNSTYSTLCITINSLSRSFRENKQLQLRFLTLANFITCLPPQKPCDIAFIPFSPKAHAKMTGIVNKAYSKQVQVK